MLNVQKLKISPENSELGKKSEYDPIYNPNKLFEIPRKAKRDEINIDSNVALPFFGYDRWNHYEVSWLNSKGKPVVAMAKITYPCTSPNIIESKSMKLYFNSFNNTKFDSVNTVQETIKNDLEKKVGSTVNVSITLLKDLKDENIHRGFKGKCIDELDVECCIYTVEPSFLTVDDNKVEDDVLYTDLLKSNCLVTNQPDWGSVQITYSGNKINEAGLLKYIVSFRNHNEFHEQCIERIFIDIMKQCKPEKLTVNGRYTRRGGLDINPIRSTEQSIGNDDIRLCRQ